MPTFEEPWGPIEAHEEQLEYYRRKAKNGLRTKKEQEGEVLLENQETPKPQISSLRRHKVSKDPPLSPQGMRVIHQDLDGFFDYDSVEVLPSRTGSLNSEAFSGAESIEGKGISLRATMDKYRKKKSNSVARGTNYGKQASRPFASLQRYMKIGKQSYSRSSHLEKKKNIDIIRMNDLERRKWFEKGKKDLDTAIEEQRRHDPIRRPEFQKDYIVHRYGRGHAPPGSGFPTVSADAAMYRSVIESNQHLDLRRHPLPSVERRAALVHAAAVGGQFAQEARAELDHVPELSTREKVDVFISKAADPLKKIRRVPVPPPRPRHDSSMDFADLAPVDDMKPCSRCKKPTTQTLRFGLCFDCVKHAKKLGYKGEFMFEPHGFGP